MPRFTKNCSNCGSLIKFSYKYCPQCGTAERQDDQDHYDEREVITAYFRKGLEYSRIVELLEREHNVSMSIRTLKNRLNEYNLKRRNVNYHEQFVRERIEEILNGPKLSGRNVAGGNKADTNNIKCPRHLISEKPDNFFS